MIKFTVYQDLEKIKNSMLYDSGFTIALLVKDGRSLSLEVRGEQRIMFEGHIYKYADSFPQKLREMIEDGSVWNNGEVRIDNNNWFEMMVGEVIGNTEMISVQDGEVYESDVPRTALGLFEIMLDWLEEMVEEEK